MKNQHDHIISCHQHIHTPPKEIKDLVAFATFSSKSGSLSVCFEFETSVSRVFSLKLILTSVVDDVRLNNGFIYSIYSPKVLAVYSMNDTVSLDFCAILILTESFLLTMVEVLTHVQSCFLECEHCFYVTSAVNVDY